MCGQNTEENAEQHAESESHEAVAPPIRRPPISPEIRRRIGEGIVLVLYFLIDAVVVWPESRGWAFIFGAVGLSAVLLMELPWRWWIGATVVIAIGSAASYWIIGPAKILDIIVSGSIEPGDSPQSDCERKMLAATPIPQKPMNVLFGDWGITMGGDVTDFPVLAIGQCKVFWVTRDHDDIKINAKLYDEGGNLIAAVKDNVFRGFQGEQTTLDQNHDLTQLTVKERGRGEIFYVRYLNSNTVRFRGIFGCPNHRTVHVTDNSPLPTVKVQKGACVNFQQGAHFGVAFVWVN
jgi:hypothetical protein